MRKLREPPADSGQAFSVPHRPRLRTCGFLPEILSQDFTAQGKQFAESTQEAESLYGRGAECPYGWASVFFRWLGTSDSSNCAPPGRLRGTKVTTPGREKRPTGGRRNSQFPTGSLLVSAVRTSLVGTRAGIPRRISTVTGLPTCRAGLNLQRPNAATAT